MGVCCHSALDIHKFCADLLGHLPRTARANGEVALGRFNRANRGYNCRSATGKDFNEPSGFGIGAPLVHRVALLTDVQALRAGKRQNRIAGDAF